jgi:hypothetical protein
MRRLRAALCGVDMDAGSGCAVYSVKSVKANIYKSYMPPSSDLLLFVLVFSCLDGSLRMTDSAIERISRLRLLRLPW